MLKSDAGRTPERRAFERRGAMAALVLLVALIAPKAFAVTLDDDNRKSYTLAGDVTVNLIAQAGDRPGTKTNIYYYLPVNLRLSKRVDNTPEFLFLKYTTEKRAEQGGMSGGLMHFLVEWGLTVEQRAEVEKMLKKDDPKATLAGAVQLEGDTDGTGSFQIISGTLSDDKMTPKLITSGRAPLVPGDKAAAAARLSPEGAQLLAATFEKSRSITDVTAQLNFKYTAIAPAAKGHVSIDWSKLESHTDSLGATYKRTTSGVDASAGGFWFVAWWDVKPNYAYSYDEMHKHFDELEKHKVIDFQWDEGKSDERVTKIREAFFQYYMNLLAEPEPPQAAPPAPASDQEKKNDPNIRIGTKYVYKKQSIEKAIERGHTEFNLQARLAFKYSCSLTENLASWYDAVRDNPKCIAAVNLNDPFYAHRDVDFILDLDAKDMFEQEANYVTVNVRKKRSSGNPFEDHITIDSKYVKEKGINATTTYARGEDTDPDVYEYQAQWSFRGGKVWPATPAWEKGSWEGVTLAAPIMPRTIEVEGDLEAMKASDITRITVQVHYSKFGQEMEDNFAISPAKNEPLVSKKIFMDRDAKGYAYRLVVDHKTDGKMATPWSAKVGDDYIYAAIPKDMLSQPDLKAVAKTAALDAATSAKSKVLEKFTELLGGTKQ